MKRGFTLVEIMIVVAVIALLAALAIPNLLRARVNANESYAQTVLKTISTACESYAVANSGNYPTSIDNLTDANPSYINEDYTSDLPRNGYNFTCTFTTTSYACNATPATMNRTGTRNFNVTTGAMMGTY